MKPSILIVDDEVPSLRLLQEHLREGGYEVRSATNAKEALHLLRQGSLPLVITDWVMPDMTGLQLCRTVRRAKDIGFVYMIVLTVHSDREHLLEAFDAGADDFLTKPLDSVTMLARLKAATRIVALEANLASKNHHLHKANAQLASLNEKLDEWATTDALTGVATRRHALSRMEECAAISKRAGHPMACIVLDVDHFKQFNDTYGHDVGDVVLREIARIMKGSTRLGEAVGRLGGEEFLIVCPDATAKTTAVLAQRICTQVASARLRCNGVDLHATVSAGVAELNLDTEGWKDLLKNADRQLYEAKHAGRNRVCATAVGRTCRTPRNAAEAGAKLAGDGEKVTKDVQPLVGLCEQAGSSVAERKSS